MMRPRGFNWHRLRLVRDVNSRSKRKFEPARVRLSLPTLFEWLLACAIAAAIVGAYFWRTELQVIWERLA
jgi:hypothetical protein